MLLLVVLMLLFNTDFENLKKSDSVEKVQLKYSLLLQRYLRFLIKFSLLSTIYNSIY